MVLKAIPFIDVDAASEFEFELLRSLFHFPRILLDLDAIDELTEKFGLLIRPGGHDVLVRAAIPPELLAGILNEAPAHVVFICNDTEDASRAYKMVEQAVDDPTLVREQRIVFWLKSYDLGQNKILEWQKKHKEANVMVNMKVGDVMNRTSEAWKELESLTTLTPQSVMVKPKGKFTDLNGAGLDQLKQVCGDAPVEFVFAADTFSFEPKSNEVHPGDVILAGLVTDRPDNLYTTLVVDNRGVALGVVYSNQQSIRELLASGRGTYWSRQRGLWKKGETSGCDQQVLFVTPDCDGDVLRVAVIQKGKGFCHLGSYTCFGKVATGLVDLDTTLQSRRDNAPSGSYTARLFRDENMLRAKIMEEADELCRAEHPNHIAAECADVFYFSLTRCVAAGKGLADVERELERRKWAVQRRAGDPKPSFMNRESRRHGHDDKHDGVSVDSDGDFAGSSHRQTGLNIGRPTVGGMDDIDDDDGISAPQQSRQALVKNAQDDDDNEDLELRQFRFATISDDVKNDLLLRPIFDVEEIEQRVRPIVEAVKNDGDPALYHFTVQFDKVEPSAPLIEAPFDPNLFSNLSENVKEAIDLAYENIRKFHEAQLPAKEIHVETNPGVQCSRIWRPIERVGLYVPGGSAVLPSTALMLGVAAQVAGCNEIWIASPPNKDGLCAPEIIYAAHKVGASGIVLAGGAQAIAALAYGTQSVPKVDKICGPGNQYVTAAKMIVSVTFYVILKYPNQG